MTTETTKITGLREIEREISKIPSDLLGKSGKGGPIARAARKALTPVAKSWSRLIPIGKTGKARAAIRVIRGNPRKPNAELLHVGYRLQRPVRSGFKFGRRGRQKGKVRRDRTDAYYITYLERGTRSISARRYAANTWRTHKAFITPLFLRSLRKEVTRLNSQAFK